VSGPDSEGPVRAVGQSSFSDLLPLHLHPAEARVFVPVKLVKSFVILQPWAALLDPSGGIAAIACHQALDISDAPPFCNDSRLREQRWAQGGYGPDPLATLRSSGYHAPMEEATSLGSRRTGRTGTFSSFSSTPESSRLSARQRDLEVRPSAAACRANVLIESSA
jgi:hypothetical protein